MRLILGIVFLMTTAWSGAMAQSQPTCELTPLSLPLFDGTPVVELAIPSATPSPELLDVTGATEVLQMYTACTNTGDPTLVWAMFTPRWFSTQFSDSEVHYLPAFEYEIANGHNEVTNPLILESVDELEMLDDGRVAVTATFSSGDLQWTDQLILANIDGQWLIDEVVLVSASD